MTALTNFETSTSLYTGSARVCRFSAVFLRMCFYALSCVEQGVACKASRGFRCQSELDRPRLKCHNVTCHLASELLPGTFSAVLRTTLTPVFDARRIECATDDMVLDSWKVFYTTPADEHDGVLLKVVTFSRDVSDHFITIRQSDLSHLTKSRVWLLWRRRVYTSTNTASLRTGRECSRLGLLDLGSSSFSNQLLDRGHVCYRVNSNVYRDNGSGWKFRPSPNSFSLTIYGALLSQHSQYCEESLRWGPLWAKSARKSIRRDINEDD